MSNRALFTLGVLAEIAVMTCFLAMVALWLGIGIGEI